MAIKKKNLTKEVFESFFDSEKDSAPSKAPRIPKMLKLDRCNQDFPKFLPDFVKILLKFPLFYGQSCGLIKLLYLLFLTSEVALTIVLM